MSREPEVDVLVPTRNRPVELATTLAGLAAQEAVAFRVLVSDQSDHAASFDTPAATTLLRVLSVQGRPVWTGRRLPRRGLAEHRAALLSRATARYVLYLDDDVWLEAGALARLVAAMAALRCGFVGAAVQGLSYLDDVRPAELAPFERWSGRPEPEQVDPNSPAWRRWTLHNAANPTHLAQRHLGNEEWIAYKVAWVGGCVLYDRAALLDSGGFDFWRQLPTEHVGEDVLAQQRVMARYGGAGILPTGAYHLEAPTTVPDRWYEARELVRAR
ncbi:MAG: glycosyltransferase family 2 protein [Pseudonocardia sp.]|nr:glycosyltransferase family 2 protein [Pseudonocardia sp.]